MDGKDEYVSAYLKSCKNGSCVSCCLNQQQVMTILQGQFFFYRVLFSDYLDCERGLVFRKTEPYTSRVKLRFGTDLMGRAGALISAKLPTTPK